jgi:ankyrin repeat protein
MTDLRPALEALSEAVRASDPLRAADALRRYPELATHLEDELPGLPFGGTALLCAVYRDDRAMVDLLLDAGADIGVRSHWWAGGFGVLDHDGVLTQHLIDRGAAVDAHAAARLGRIDRLEELLASDPTLVHARGGDGQTPLHFASSVEVAALLLDRGADIDARDVDHESTAAQYMLGDRQEVARYLVERGAETDLLMAAALGDRTRAERHLEADPACIRMSVSETWFPKKDPRAGGTIYIWTLGGQKTAPLVARDHGHEYVLQLLLDRSPEGWKLAAACELGDEGLVASLRTRHPDVANALTDDDRDRLVRAAETGNTTAVRLMLHAGWPLDARGDHGGTVLHWAAWLGNAEMVREILRHGVEVDVRGDEHDMPPLGWAIHGSEHSWNCRKGDYPGVVEALLEAGAEAPSASAPAGTEAVKAVLAKYEERKGRRDS